MVNLFYETKSHPIHYHESSSLTNLPHLHQELELILVYHGEIIAYSDAKSYALKDGDLFLSFPNQVHFYDTKTSGHYGVCIFSPDVIYLQQNNLLKKVPICNSFHSEAPVIKETISILSHSTGEFKDMTILGCLNILLSQILPTMQLINRNATNDSAIIKQFVSYCSEHYKEQLSLETISKNLGVSKFYLSHLISDSLKIHLKDYINCIRINRAVSLLDSTDIKIADISEDIGYGTIRSFNRAFKKIMKLTPSEYRNLS